LATTSAALAAAVLDSLEKCGLEFAVLHGEESIAAGNVFSDLDVVVGTHPAAALSQASIVLGDAGVYPILIWDYDVGGTTTVFLATADASEGVQLDLMYDPLGRGKYGAKTGPMLASRVSGERWPTVGTQCRTAYLIRKRHVKGDFGRLERLLSDARQFANADFNSIVRETFSSPVADSILGLVAGNGRFGSVPFARSYKLRNALRLVRRVLRPTGFWVEIGGESGSELIGRVLVRFKRFLPVVETGRRPRGVGAQVRWVASDVVPVRWRPGLFVSQRFGLPRGDLRIPTFDDVDRLCSRIVDAMRIRTGI
jgi:hypothetical protein